MSILNKHPNCKIPDDVPNVRIDKLRKQPEKPKQSIDTKVEAIRKRYPKSKP